MTNRSPIHLGARRIQAYSWGTQLAALLVGLLGLINVVWALFYGLPQALNSIMNSSPLLLAERGRLFNFLFGSALIFLAGGLRRKKRTAWVCVGLAVVTILPYHWVRLPERSAPALIGGGLLVWLAAAHGRYTTPSSPRAVRVGLRTWLQALLGVMLVGTVGLSPEGFELESSYRGAVRAAVMFGLFFDPAPQVVSGFKALIANAIYITAAAAWGYLLLMLDSPLPAPPPPGAEKRRKAAQIVREYGRTSQAHLALLEDKRYFFTPGGSVVAFSVCGRVAVTLGDPIGPASDAAEAIALFTDFCARHDWLAAFCLTSSEHLDHYRKFGFRQLCMGHEGIVQLKPFTLRGNSNKTIRKRYNRLTASGYRVEIVDPPIADELLAELRSVSDEWLEMALAAEKRFFLAWFDETYVRNERIAVVRSPSGSVCAFTNLVPEYQLNEISIDLMRRRRQIESGTMDFLFVSLFLWARKQGYDTFNLGLSPLFGVGEGSSPTLLERGIRYMYHHGNFYDFKGLNGFKIKFRPTWTPQYLVYPGLLGLGWVGLAMARVNAGENETLWEYFRTRPKQIEHVDPNDLALMLSETQGD